MEYHGRLYGKVGKKYFDTGRTSEEFDKYQKMAVELQLEKENTKPIAVCYKCKGRLENHLDYIRCTKCGWYWEPQDEPIDEDGLEPEAWGGGFADNN